MLTTIHTTALHGVEAIPVAVEVQVKSGKERFQIIGLGDSAVKESRDRVCAAIAHSGFWVPEQILVNLAPADLRKEGASFDLAIAVAILIASGQLPSTAMQDAVWFGELSLHGGLKAVRGTAACVAEAKRAGRASVMVPAMNLAEAKLIEEIEIYGFRNLADVVLFLRDGVVPEIPVSMPPVSERLPVAPHKLLSEVLGQELAKRAITIAAAGGHNLLMIGPPGCGKSMLAERFPGLLPRLTQEETLECVKIHSAASQQIDNILKGVRPFRHPHYIISDAGLVGGGNPPRPGEITLAHNGVLFLDEFPEFKRSALESLRLPLERGTISVARARHSIIFPARFQLIAAMNPCPCGKLGGSESAQGRCTCPRASVGWYLRKLSQPILDRIDLHVEMSAVAITDLAKMREVRNEAEQEQLRSAIAEAHRKQRERNGGVLNSGATQERMRKLSHIHPESLTLLERAAARLELTARGYTRVLRVARTIADLENSEEIAPAHLAESLSFRGLDRLQKYANSEV